jgi:hypothetical protein
MKTATAKTANSVTDTTKRAKQNSGLNRDYLCPYCGHNLWMESLLTNHIDYQHKKESEQFLDDVLNCVEEWK